MLVGWVVEVQPGWEVHVAAEFDDDDDALSFATRVRAILDALREEE